MEDRIGDLEIQRIIKWQALLPFEKLLLLSHHRLNIICVGERH